MNSSQEESQVTPISPGDIVEELKTIYQRVLDEQRRQLNDLLNLQKLLNQIHSTTVLRENESVKKNHLPQIKEEKKQFNIQRIGQKIEQLIDDTEEILVVQNTADPKKLPSIQLNKTKKETKKPQPIVQKKPPVPTVNRSNDPGLRMVNPTKYVPPRNKNEVTGKVTQTKILTQEKVFKPQLNTKSTTTSTKTISSSVQKRSTTSTTPNYNHKQTTPNIPAHKLQSLGQPSQSQNPHPDVDSNSISEYKNLRANNKTTRLKQFSKPLQEIADQIKGKKQSAKKRVNFKQMIEKYQHEEMGHRGTEEKRRLQFIKKLNNFAVSVNKSNCNEITHSIPKRVWQEYLHIFQFNSLLQTLEAEVNSIVQQHNSDLRIDPKQAYRVQVKMNLIESELQKIKQSTQIEVPDKVQLTFKPIAPSVKKEKVTTTQSDSNIGLETFYQNLIRLLNEVQSNQSLTVKELSILRVVAEIGLYGGKKSPLIVKADEFEDWKESFHDVNDCQTSQQEN